MAGAKKETKVKKTKKIESKPKVKRKKVTLQFKAEPGSRVFVAGSFNEWKANDKKMNEVNDGEYSINLMLPAGDYEYKIISNGRWLPDPNAAGWSPNPFGSFNSLLEVKA